MSLPATKTEYRALDAECAEPESPASKRACCVAQLTAQPPAYKACLLDEQHNLGAGQPGTLCTGGGGVARLSERWAKGALCRCRRFLWLHCRSGGAARGRREQGPGGQ